jgi:uncharacterized protein YcaQ
MVRGHPVHVSEEAVRRLWFERQGLSVPRGASELSKRDFVRHLERTGGLQLDTISVVERAHYLTLWSRFGPYDRARVDRWVYDDRMAYEYWGHEASILPISHLPLGLRRMRGFPSARTRKAAWWKHYDVPGAVKRHVLQRLREEGALESSAFERRPGERDRPGPGWAMPLPKQAKRALQLLWLQGRVAVRTRRHFRRVYDLAERVYPEVPPATIAEYEDSWLHIGLSGNGIASERHLVHYVSAPGLQAAERRRVIARSLKQGRIREVEVRGRSDPFYALPADLDRLGKLPEPRGTTLLGPFDSLLWQRARAEDLLGFRYRVEIYVPPARREFGYYVLPILHDGRLVGRLDPKLHRERGLLEIKRLRLEPDFQRSRAFRAGLTGALESLMEFLDARDLKLPRSWGKTLGM